MRPHKTQPIGKAFRLPFDQIEGMGEDRDRVDGNCKQGHEKKQAGKLGQEQGADLDRERDEVRIVARIREDDIPLEHGDETDQQHEERGHIAFFHPGGSLVLKKGISEQHNIGHMSAEHCQEGLGPDDLLLHLVPERHDIVVKKTQVEMPGEDQKMLQVAPNRADQRLPECHAHLSIPRGE